MRRVASILAVALFCSALAHAESAKSLYKKGVKAEALSVDWCECERSDVPAKQGVALRGSAETFFLLSWTGGL